MRKAKQSGAQVIDVDGSYLHRKREKLLQDGVSVAPLDLPSIPVSGWKSVNEGNYKDIATNVPCVTSGMLVDTFLSNPYSRITSSGLVYSYLAEGTGNTTGRGAFRALQRGFNHWSSSRVSHIEVNVENSQFCHVRCHTTPSMRPGTYHVYILLSQENELAVSVEIATCQCAAG